MTTIRRLSNSCLTITTDAGVTLFDPGFWTFDSGEVDLESIGEVNRILVTHEHGDHLKPEFVRWLLDRGTDITVHANQAVADILAKIDVEVIVETSGDLSCEDVDHEIVPNGSTVPNRSYTVGDVFTHPGDSYQPTSSAPILALPLLIPWGSMTQSVAFARRLAPQFAVPIHDFYLSSSGRRQMAGMAKAVLAQSDIELVPLDWNESATL